MSIFYLPDTANLECQLFDYNHIMSVFRIRVSRRISEHEVTPIAWISFNGVSYIECLSHWIGAEFRLGTDQEYLDLRRRIHHLPDISDSKLLPIAKLYIAMPQENYFIRILAAEGKLFHI